MYHFTRDRWRTWFASAEAHNTVTADGSPTRADGATYLVAERHTSTYDFLVVTHRKIPGVLAIRRVFYDRRLGAIIVEDDLTADAPRTFHQWWHLHPDAYPTIGGRSVFTGRSGSRANAWITQLGEGSSRIVRGSSDPIQGWTSFDYGVLKPAPVVDVSAHGTRVQYVTLIVPSSSHQPTWTVSSFSKHATGFDLTIDVDGRRDRISVRSSTAWEEMG